MKEPYFRIEVPVAQEQNGKWRAKSRIVRLDTGEHVGSASSQPCVTREDAVQAVVEELEAQIAELPRPPDWGSDAASQQLVERYLKLRDRTYGFVARSELRSGPEAETLLRQGAASEREASRILKEAVASLTQAQQVDLSGPTAAQRRDPDNPWHLDALAAKQSLYRLIKNPTHEAYEAHLEIERLLGSASGFDEIMRDLIETYGSLDQPDYTLLSTRHEAHPHQALIAGIGASFTLHEDTDPNTDVSLGLIIDAGDTSLVLRLSLVGPYALLMRVLVDNTCQIVAPPISRAEDRIQQLLEDHAIRLIDQQLAETPIPFATAANLFHLLFIEDELPWADPFS